MATPIAQITEPTPREIYGTFFGTIDPDGVRRIANSISKASAISNLKKVHLAFQSNGGCIGEGVALYNLFRVLPFEVVLYNIGTIASIAVVAFLGAKQRMTSTHAAFMMHRTQTTTQLANTQTIRSFAESAILADNRTEAILRHHITMPDEKWAHFNHNDLWFSAEDAVKFGVADEIAEFDPPAGAKLFHV
jgi:ATP-dependent Clp protease, protease subunit